ncbi:hypothetical protein JCM15457_2375 [Liquorilactobacillus sucicola DSM 21376 = JCM 15457]|nr:hypothetical protein JCM15457_2375 [Liquorilactobacillus sucicola DSM 21376 = JCM 15457]
MVEGNHRNTKAIINLKAIEDNIVAEQKRMVQGQELFAVVKANAYGHGIIQLPRQPKGLVPAAFVLQLLMRLWSCVKLDCLELF